MTKEEIFGEVIGMVLIWKEKVCVMVIWMSLVEILCERNGEEGMK